MMVPNYIEQWISKRDNTIFFLNIMKNSLIKLLTIYSLSNLRRGYKISAWNFQRWNLALSQMSVKACCIPVRRVWPLVFENVFRFTLVAMVTKQRLWLAKQQNKRNSKTIHRMVTIFGVWVYMDNTHKTMKPDFSIGCHGNR